MESIIFSDSPLAEYLEGQGNAEFEWAVNKDTDTITPPSPPYPTFAPRGPPQAYSKFRRKLPKALKLEAPASKAAAVARFHDACSIALNSRLRRAENASFLEQFRYTIVASQLLNLHANPISWNPVREDDALPSTAATNTDNINLTWVGLLATTAGAFVVACTAHWIKTIIQTNSSLWTVPFLLCLVIGLASLSYGILRRYWLKYLRKQAIENASGMVKEAQRFDTTASTAINLIQEVELVSRGYRLSNPLPPVSRIEESSNVKRCVRLRKYLRQHLTACLENYTRAYNDLRPEIVEEDFDRYCDIYEITQSDLQSISPLMLVTKADPEHLETLKSLKQSFQKIHLTRKLYLCSLLALDATGGSPDFDRWSMANETMRSLSSALAFASHSLDKLLSEEDGFAIPVTPKSPLPPNRERARAQFRKLSSLSQGIRGLQAKMHILREESDRTLEASEDVSDLAPNLLAQYDSIGADLRALMQEWEDGKAHLATNIDTHNRRISSSSFHLSPLSSSTATHFPSSALAGIPNINAHLTHSRSRSSTPSSLSGSTVVGSPRDALKDLNRDALIPNPMYHGGGDLPSLSGGSSADEGEVFEAIAMPKQRERSTLSREERIRKMREERLKELDRRERAGVKGGMLRELETVIKLRPRGKTTGAVVPTPALSEVSGEDGAISAISTMSES